MSVWEVPWMSTEVEYTTILKTFKWAQGLIPNWPWFKSHKFLKHMFPIPSVNHSSFGSIYFLVHQWELSQVLACENTFYAIYQCLPRGILHSAPFSLVFFLSTHLTLITWLIRKMVRIHTSQQSNSKEKFIKELMKRN